MFTFKETLEWGTKKCTKDYKSVTPGENENEEVCPACGRVDCAQKLAERYNNGTDQFIKIQNAMNIVGDFMVSLSQDDMAPDVKRNKRKLKNMEKIWGFALLQLAFPSLLPPWHADSYIPWQPGKVPG